MQSLKAFKLWLSMQCQMLGNVQAAILVQCAPENPQILAKWPSADIDSTLLRGAIQPVLEKQRLHLQLLDSQHYLLGYPLVIDGQQWGVLACTLALTDKKELPSILKWLKLGQFWLQFILHLTANDSSPNDRASIETAPLEPDQTAVASASQSNVASANGQIAIPPLNEALNTALVQITASLLKENSLQETGITLVNLLAGLLQATRVSLGVLDGQGKNLQLEAVSFSANFDKRTQAMLAIREAMAEAIDQGMRIHCTSNEDEQPAGVSSQIKQAHQHLLHGQQLQSVSSFLLRKGERILGAITIELDRRSLTTDQELFAQQAAHSAAAIMLLQQQAAAGLWQGLKHSLVARLQRLLGPDSWRGKLIAMAAAAFVVALFVPVTYHLSADANLQTTEKHLVVSPQDAYLGKISARPGDAVKQGALLAQLNDEDLRLERRKIASQAQQYRQAYDSALANGNRVEAAIASAQLDQATIQVQLLDQQLARTQLLAPVDGIIVSDDIAQTQGAPVKQGDVLFEIAAGQSYRVQLFVDERDIAQVQPGQSGALKLSSLPTEVFNLRVKLITPISEVREGRNYFRVELEIDNTPEQNALLRPGMTGTGKVQIGTRALGWIWFHDLWHWLRLNLW
ncbi:HlyD family efflux transporter periplasmic adaptor subunit [Cellvibrio sp. KY-GH-1]|uniref:efflux RND transporter periplasmic adaptor subunit n=1 Tax=Cellvibrio sp. KY-GH-1 TaxID=2303332 RepID=UPI00124833C7|nr:HlyD family efflux transporter periplasmic adaptor subunit [Cellvibrio sp. KY-GH-1]QEY14519.1 HlyD family efflux transporter periplasmic adaptor subunit [Cellvibrio sp. KY-GH-1]